MFKYDFIILYELRKREMENAVLLAMMLEKKGYKVAIEYRRSARMLFQKADVVLAPFLYNNDDVMEFTLHFFHCCKKIINMQYEQLFLKLDEDQLNDLPRGFGKKALHISWGNSATERYKSAGINPSNIFEIGNIAIDLNTTKYRSVFLSKNDISKKFKLSPEKKWLLFISSFSCAGLTKVELEKWKKQTASTEYFAEISDKTQPLILDYFEKLAKTHPEVEIIYRPHPHEVSCDRMIKLEKKYANFKVILDFSIRQWILISDYISTWFSTSLVDVFFAQKPCAIIRPISIMEEYDYPIYRNQTIISDYSDLENFLTKTDKYYNINPATIKKYYSNSFEANTFEKLRDICIQVKHEKKYEYNFSKDLRTLPLFWTKLIKLYIYKFLLTLAEFIDYSKITPLKYRADVQNAYIEMHNYKDEITFYRKMFSRIVNNEKT